nr:hypothetical protein [Tanacetum cinerariifolium]
EPILSSLGDLTFEKIIASGNNIDTQEGNGKRVAYLVVDNYVKNTWSKYGQNLDVNLLKEDVGNVPVWVKFNGVPMTTFSEDGMSVIATKISTPLMLDSHTSDMCMQSWSMSSYARATIVLRADVELKVIIVVAMPKLVDVMQNLKNPRQTARGVQVGPKVDFKPIKQVYRHFSNKNSSNTSDENLLPEVVVTVNAASDSEVEDVDNEHAVFMASTSLKSGNDSAYDTTRLFEQWRTTKQDDDYDPYDDMYE